MNTFAKITKSKLGELEVSLADFVKRLTGLNDVRFNINIDRIRNGEEVLVVTSNELADYQYPKIFKSLTIGQFGGGWSTYNNKENMYWLPLKYRYTHFSGGRNGSELATFWIDEYGNIRNYRNELE